MSHTHIHITDLGQTVYCDLCNRDWTDRPESGGFLFGSNAVCPACAPRVMADIISYNEQSHIKAHCPPGLSFWQWCLKLRGGNNQIRVITGGKLNEAT